MSKIIDAASDMPLSATITHTKYSTICSHRACLPATTTQNSDEPPAELAYTVTGDTIDILAQASDKFEGAYADFGAQVTVVGKP